MGRKERTAFESKSSVNRDCQLKHNLSVFDSLHSIDLIIGRVNSRHFLPTYLPTYSTLWPTYATLQPTQGIQGRAHSLVKVLGFFDSKKKSKSRLLCFGWESFQAFIFWRARVKKVTPEIYPIHTEKSEHQSFPNWRLFWEFFFVLHANTKQYDLVWAIYYLVTTYKSKFICHFSNIMWRRIMKI